MKKLKALVTVNGYCVNVPMEDGKTITFFITPELEYKPWVKTIALGMPVPTNEYGRLKNEIGLSEIELTDEQAVVVRSIAQKLQKEPLMGILDSIVERLKSRNCVDANGFYMKRRKAGKQKKTVQRA